MCVPVLDTSLKPVEPIHPQVMGLSRANVRYRKRRYLASGLAVAISMAFIALFVGGASLMVTTGTMAVAGQFNGTDALVINPQGEKQSSADIARELQSSSLVGALALSTEARVTLQPGDLGIELHLYYPGPMSTANLVAGREPKNDAEVVIDETTASSYDLGLGDTVTLEFPDGPAQATVVGYAKAPLMSGAQLYVAPAVLSKYYPQALNYATINVRANPQALSQLGEKGGAGSGLLATLSQATGLSLSNSAPLLGALDSASQQQVFAQELAKFLEEKGYAATVGPLDEGQEIGLVSDLVDPAADLTVVPAASALELIMSAIRIASRVALAISLVFPLIAAITAIIVVATTFQVIAEGRRKEMALLRCVGATRKQVRNLVLRETAIIGLVSTLLGLLVAWALLAAVSWWWDIRLPGSGFSGYFSALTPFVLVVLTLIGVALTVAAGLKAALSVSRISPVAAMRPVIATASGPQRLPWVRLALVILFGVPGLAALIVPIGTDWSKVGGEAGFGALYRFMIMLGGGVFTFFAAILLASLLAPRFTRGMLQIWQRLSPRKALAELAAENVARKPGRTAVTVAAVTLGVTLVVMMMTGAASVRATINTELAKHQDLANIDQINNAISVSLLVVVVLLGVSVVVSIIGVGNTLSLSVAERAGETALLRAVGMTRREVRAMTNLEALSIGLAGALFGTALGIMFGWFGLHALPFNETPDEEIMKLVFEVPYLQVAAVILGAIGASLMASYFPARTASRTAPVAALAQAA